MEIKTSQITKLQKRSIDKTSFSRLPEEPGVYFFFTGKNILYIGKALNLKNRLRSYLNIDLGPKTRQMVNTADAISFIKVTSELESLLLEAKLINHFKPQYNIVLKDDKHPLYITITDDEFPRVIAIRKTDKTKYLKIYGPFPSSQKVRSILRMIRKVIPFSDHKITKKACLYSQIGLCNPCPNTATKIEKRDYRKNIRNIQKLLDGSFSLVEKNIIREMEKYSKQNKFEKAADFRDKLKVLKYITQPQTPVGNFLENPNLAEDIKAGELLNLDKLLKKQNIHIKKLRRLECYDVAHLAGASPTASMVVFIKGEAEKKEYRHFKINQKKSQSDYDSLKEVARRRQKHYQDWGKPDLVIVDGGLGQVKIFNEIFKEDEIVVVGIAKHPERMVFVNGNKVRLQGSTLNLISRMRDEAHRFARRYHHLLLKKNLMN